MTGKREFTDEERDAYRGEKREEAEQALDALLTQEGWATWLRLRKNLHGFSWTNQALIATQAYTQAALAEAKDERAPAVPCSAEPVLVKAACRWKCDGYHPVKGSKGLFVWTYHTRGKKQAATWSCCSGRVAKGKSCPACGKQGSYFLLKPVFDASQVVSFDTGQPPVIELPKGEPLQGDEPGRTVLPGLGEWVEQLDEVLTVDYTATSERGELGSWNHRTRHMRICATDGAGEALSQNAALRVLIHETAHALGVSSKDKKLELTYAEAEVAADCVSYVTAATAGLDTGPESIPYMAGWGGAEARQKVRQLAELIDKTAKRIEEPILALLADEDTNEEVAAA